MPTLPTSFASRPVPYALILSLAIVISCTAAETAASRCADVAGAAGVPPAVVKWIQTPPDDLGRLERVTIQRAVEEFDLQLVCGETLATLEQSTDRSEDSAGDPENTRVSPSATPFINVPTESRTKAPTLPQIPFPTPGTARPPSEADLRVRDVDDFMMARELRNSSPGIYNMLSDLTWVKDGIYGREADAVFGLVDMGVEVPGAAQLLLERDWLADGVTEEEARAFGSLGQMVWDTPSVVEHLVLLPWLEDGLTEDESWMISALAFMAEGSENVVRTLAFRPWLADDVNEDEYLVVEALAIISDESDEAGFLSRMPFLDTIEPADPHVLMSLGVVAEDSPTTFSDIMDHPMIADGITDDEAPLVSLVHYVRRASPGLLDRLLTSGSTQIERRAIELPMAGPVALVIVRTEPGSGESMDLLEDTVRFSEHFMGEPFPEKFVLLLFTDLDEMGFAGHYTQINIGIDREFDIDQGGADTYASPLVFAHEVAHYYWSHSEEDWLDEGAAELMSYAYTETIGTPNWTTSDVDLVYGCPIQNISSLKELEDDSDYSECVYALGGSLFLDLYRTLDGGDFHRGFRTLYLSRVGAAWPDDSTDSDISQLRAAFQFNSEAIDHIIPRWFGE